MTETTTTTGTTDAAGGLGAMRLPQLQALASELGVKGISRMRKGDLLAAIHAHRSGQSAPQSSSRARTRTAEPAADTASTAPAQASGSNQASGSDQASGPDQASAGTGETARSGRPQRRRSASDQPAIDQPAVDQPAGSRHESGEQGSGNRESQPDDRAASQPPTEQPPTEQPRTEQPRTGQPSTEQPRTEQAQTEHSSTDQSSGQSRTRTRGRDGESAERQPDDGRNRRQDGNRQDSNDRQDNRRDRQQNDRQQNDRQQDSRQQNDRQQNDRQQSDRQQDSRQQGDRQQNDRQQNDRQQDNRGRNNDRNRNNGPDDDDDDRGGRRRNRYRDRKRRGRSGQGDPMGGAEEPEVREDDVLLPVAGILDVLDSYAFVRTSGFLPGPNDVYVSLAQVRKHGLRKGDAIRGAVKQPRDGDNQGGNQSNRQKFNALVRLDSVNQLPPEDARNRPEFGKLTPLYPQERLRLETTATNYTNRVIDLVSPIGKGQRALIVSPPKAGKTMVMQSIANAITTNNPECHLMVVLVDERPEEVTDFERSVDGEVIASTFDRPAGDHTMIAELAIERAKRLVELGHDVVVLLDGITRLGRAYNLAAPASGRIMSGGVDSSALYPPKKFFGAARNIEGGGSLTIIATALVETGSRMDEVIFEEFKGTGNCELRLSRSLADKRVFPAVDVNPSGTRREEILISREELAVLWKLRRVFSALDANQALELLLSQLKKTRSNAEFLLQVAKSTPGSFGDDD